MLFQMDAGQQRAETEAVRKSDVPENHLVKEGQVHEGAEKEALDGSEEHHVRGAGCLVPGGEVGGRVGADVDPLWTLDSGAGFSRIKVLGTLLRHIEVWEDVGARVYELDMIKQGFKLSMMSRPRAYEEGGVKSFEVDWEFAIQAVQIMFQREVGKMDVTYVGNKRLRFDLSRGMNEGNASYSFKIENIHRFLQMVKQEGRMFAFDLKLAYQLVGISS